MMADRSKRLFLCVACLAWLGIIGCDEGPKLRPNRVIVTGTVTYQGKPLPGGHVLFHSAKDPILNSEGSIEKDGTYVADAPIGLMNVAVDTRLMQVGMPDRYVEIPAKYADPARSGLTYDVKPGENKDVNFNLQ